MKKKYCLFNRIKIYVSYNKNIKDTVVNASGAGGTVTVLVNWDDENSSNNNVLDASGLDGHANGAKLHIKKLWWQVNGGVADDDKNWFFLEFKGASSDTLAINLVGQVTMMELLD